MDAGEAPAGSVRDLALAKLPELEATHARTQPLVQVMRSAATCRCPTLAECADQAQAAGVQRVASDAGRCGLGIRPGGPMDPATSSFPSLRIGRDSLVPQGSFAEAQAQFLRPDAAAVAELTELCKSKGIGIVAHFYMDAELQGILTAMDWKHTFIADSLKMAGAAVDMVADGCEHIVVLGVDFMSENVRAVLDHAGLSHIPVYRLATEAIGCSLAESAEAPAYEAWLKHAATHAHPLHVVYINTSLMTKAVSHSLVPTITCTSSNVVQTILQATAQDPEITVWYGPDTYMGANLAAMFAQFSQLDDAAIAAIHPAHDRTSMARVRDRFQYFRQGACIVHHMFGDDVVARVRAEHAGAYLTAHLEVPGEMFALAAAAQQQGRGAVGSTSNILGFITDRVDEAVQAPDGATIPVVLGTEAGMITAIVDQVQRRLVQHGRDDIEVEVIFPVASEAVAQAPDSELAIIPGVAGGEGCSVAGGCATCPFMKMNDLAALFHVAERIGRDRESTLAAHAPEAYRQTVAGRTAADLGSEPILHMRAFQQSGRMPDALMSDIVARDGALS